MSPNPIPSTVKPYLAKAPENVSTDAGSTVHFSCAVEGVPRPKV